MATLPKNPAAQPKPHSSFTPRPSGATERSMAASTAKTYLLALLDEVDTKGIALTITKRGRPVARLVPIFEPAPASIFGCMKGTGRITGDIVGPEPDIWEAMSE